MSRKDSKRTIIESFNVAIHGLVHAVKSQRHMRIHIILAIMVLVASLFLNLSRIELILLVITIAIVLITEIINTAIEYMVDLVTEEHHPLAKIIKDLSAAAVLFSAFCATVVGYLVFVKKEVLSVFEHSIVLTKIVAYPPYITGIIIFLVIFIALLIKASTSKSPALAGGMPSIHTAVAFSLATIIFSSSENIYLYALSLFIAGLVAQSRYAAGIHNLWEITVGALLGTSVTLFILQILI